MKQSGKWLQQILYQPIPQKHQNKWDVMISDQTQTQLPNEEIEEFLTAIDKLHPTLKMNLGGLHELVNLRKLATAIEMEKVITVADASIGTRSRAAHGYIIESRCGSFRILGVGPIDCDEDDLESTRAELWGQIAIQTMINVICDLYSVNTGEVQVYGDNIDTLVKTKLDTTKMAFLRYFKPNVDVKLLLQRLRQSCQPKVQISPERIKGHQDDQVDFCYDTAPQSVRRNIDMDEISKTFLKSNQGTLEPTTTQLLIPGQQATLVLDQTPVNNNIYHHVNLHYYGHHLESRCKQQTEISSKHQEIIQWRAFEREFTKVPAQDRIATFKLIHDKWPTNMKQVKWDGEKDPMCQWCIDREETSQHIFACKSTLASKEFKTGMTTFRSTLRKIRTAPMIISAFEMLFQSYRKGYKLPLQKSIVQNDNMSDVIQQIYDHQMEIGLKFFVQGFISSKWEIAQNLFLKKDDFNDSLTDWNTKLIRAIWKFSTFLWHSRCDFVHGKQNGQKKVHNEKN